MKLPQFTAYLISQAFYWTVFVVATAATIALLAVDVWKERRNGQDS